VTIQFVLSVSSVLVIHDQLGKGHRRNTTERSPERRAMTSQFTTSYGEMSLWEAREERRA
jgi:hypothetical protein